jgi:hypothetical protein
MKKMLSLMVIGTLLMALIHVPAFGGDESAPSSPLSSPTRAAASPPHQDPPGELIIADVLFLRPAGMVACVVGVVGAFLTWPFAATSNSGDLVGRQLMIKPFRYTFERPLGQMDWPDSTDDTNL